MFDKNDDTCWNSDQVSAFIGFIHQCNAIQKRFIKYVTSILRPADFLTDITFKSPSLRANCKRLP